MFCNGRLGNPFPLYHRLRSEDPVHWSDLADSWILTRYDDVVSVQKNDPRLTAERISPLMNQLPEALQAETQPLRRHLSAWMQNFEPPHHTRLRTLVNKAFTARLVEELRPRIQQIVDELLDAVRDAGKMDVIRDFADPLPTIIIAEMLGVPTVDREQFKQWSDDIATFLEGVGATFFDQAKRAQQSVLELTDYVGRIAAQRRKHPQDDLISALVAVEESGDKLSETELFGMCSFLLEAGNETTTGLLGNGLLALLQNPDQMQKLKHDPSLIGNGIEELIRYNGPLQRNSRVATQDFEFGGRRIRQGQRIWAMLGAANRDPAQFPDPDRLDINRKVGRHVGFGYGIHFCLGAPLARLEGQIAFTTLLGRLPELRLASETVEYREGIAIRTLKSLPVAF